MFRLTLPALLFVLTTSSASGADPSKELQEAYFAQLQLAQALHSMNTPAFGKSATEKVLLSTGENLSSLLEQEYGATALDREKLLAVSSLATSVQRVLKSMQPNTRLSKDILIDESFHTSWRAEVGGDSLAACRRAIDHEMTKPLRINLVENGSIWIRIAAPAPGTWAFDTFITEFDTRLSLYRDCRDIGRPPLLTSDDALGLGSIVGFTAKAMGETRIVKLERLGGLGDLVVAKGAGAMSISGRVTREADGSPVADLTVGATGAGIDRRADTDGNGNYVFFPYGAGDYWVRTGVYFSGPHGAADLVDEAYPNIPCADRHVGSFSHCAGTVEAVEIEVGQDVSAIDFALETGGLVSGRVTSEPDGTPVADADVEIVIESEGGNRYVVRETQTDFSGRFRLDGLAGGDWRIEFDHPRYLRERWNNVPCGTPLGSSDCPSGSGQILSIVGDESIPVSAAMKPLDGLRIRTTSMGENVAAKVSVYTANGTHYTSAGTAADGLIYTHPLPAGNYRLVIHSSGLFSRIYGGPNCYGNCSESLFAGELLSIPRTSAAPLQIDLDPLARMSGTIRDAQTGAPIPNARIRIYRSGSLVDSQFTDSLGQYASDRLQPGNYFLHAGAAQHVDELFPDVPCEAANPTFHCAATQPIVVGYEPKLPQLDLMLSSAGLVQGRVRTFNDGVGPAITPSQVNLQRLSSTDGSIIASEYITPFPSGFFGLWEMPVGTHLFAMSSSGYRTQLYAGLDCVNGSFLGNATCPHTAATPVTWVGSESVGGINFDLSAHQSRIVRVRDSITLAPLAGVAVDHWTVEGVWKSTSITNAQGMAQVQISSVLPSNSSASSAILTTDNTLGYLDQVFDANECAVGTSAYRGSCSLVGAVVVPVFGTEDLPYPRLEILLRSADPLFKSDFE